MIHITDGNNKMKNTGSISLPPIIACGENSFYCKDHCYARKFYRMYPEVKNAWDENYLTVNKDRKVYFESIRRYLLKKQIRFFRWHISGDILDQNYLENMKVIAKDYFFTNFLVFTKQYHLDFNNLPSNLSVVISAWPELELLELNLPIAFVDFGYEERKKHVNYIMCPEKCDKCRACWYLKKYENVLLTVKRK